MASNLTEKVAHGVEELRDRAADTLSADGSSIFRSLRRLGDRIDDVEASILSEVLDVEERLADEMRALRRRRPTSWPRRMFWMIVGASIVASVLISSPKRAKKLHDQVFG